MKERFQDLIDQYIEREKKRIAEETEKRKRGVLEEFAFFMDTRKAKVWNIPDITEEDGKAYYNQLKNSADKSRGNKIQILNHFMDFAVKEKRITIRPWKELSGKEKHVQGRIKAGKGKREKLVKYLERITAESLFEKRDKAMLLLLINHELRYTEISNLDMQDVKEDIISVNTPVAWRTKETKLSHTENQALYAYIFTRLQENKTRSNTDEEALFIGYKRNRISPGMVKQILKDYIMLAEED